MKKRILFILFIFWRLMLQAQEVEAIVSNAQTAMGQQDFESAAAFAQSGLDRMKDENEPYYKILLDVFIEANMAVGNFQTAEKSIDNYLLYLEKVNGKRDTSMVSYIAGKGGIAFMRGDYNSSIVFFEESSSILEENKLQQTEDFAAIQSNLGMIYAQVGELDKALRPLLNAKVFFEKNSNKYVYELSLVYNNLGDAYHSRYAYAKATNFYEHSLKMYDLLGDHSSSDYISTRGNYALLKKDQGNIEEAIQMLNENEQLIKNYIGEESEEYALLMNNLGQVYKQKGEYRLAEEYLLASYTLKQQLYDEWHPSMMTIMNNIAMFYFELGKLDLAERYLLRLIHLQEEYHINNFHQLVLYHNNLMVVYNALNEKQKMLKIAKHVTTLIEDKEGNNTVNYFSSLCSYSAALMDNEKKLEEAQEVMNDLNRLYPQLKKYLPHEDKIAYWNNRGALAMYKEAYIEAVAAYETGMKLVLEVYTKNHPEYAFFQSNMAYSYKMQGDVDKAYGPMLASTQHQLDQVKTLFPVLTETEKELYIQKITPTLAHFYVFALKNGETKKELIENMVDIRLASKSLVLRSSDQTRKAIKKSKDEELKVDYENWLTAKKELTKHLTLSKKELARLEIDLEAEKTKVEKMEKEVLRKSAFLTNSQYTPDWRQVANKLNANEAAVEVIRVQDDNYEKSKTLFYIFIIIKKGQKVPEIVVVENGGEMERKEYKYYRNAIKYKTKTGRPYEVYWSEVSKALEGIDKVYFSSDGIYHKINLNTLYNKRTEQYLLEEIQIEYRASLNSLVDNTEVEAYRKVCLFGHPNYYLDLEEALNNYTRGESPVGRTLRTDVEVWTDLPGTKEEVQSISKLLLKGGWQVELHTEEEAIENKIKALTSTGVLHIATHGFFDATQDTLSRYSEDYFINPMMKSGVVFSGAGVPLEPHQLKDVAYFEDGILYANEVLSMNLDTRCVILSACETGLGEIRNQEGVYGLQRAFLIAGADAVIMSLWTVDDIATKDLMVTFYSHYNHTMELEDSFNKAMKEMQIKYADPFYWGAFILMKK